MTTNGREIAAACLFGGCVTIARNPIDWPNLSGRDYLCDEHRNLLGEFANDLVGILQSIGQQ